MLDNSSTIEEAEEVIDEDVDDLEKYILCDRKKRGFYLKQRRYDKNDIRLLAESVYASRFIDEKRAKHLIDVACSMLSEEQAQTIKHDAFLADRVKTTNTTVYYSVSTINDAMRKGTRDVPHIPHKISFKYLKRSINDLSQQVEKRQGELYVVSPFKLLINDGNYYLLAFSDKHQQMRVYRVDRMKEVCELKTPRDGEHEFITMDLGSFVRRTFGMFNGESKTITLRFTDHLLDTAVDRFGTKGVRYSRADDEHFYLETEVAISVQFFGWLLGFGDMVQIMGPASVVSEFKDYLDNIRALY